MSTQQMKPHTQATDGREGLQQQSMAPHERYQAAGVPVWGGFLIAIGLLALFGNLGIGLGWVFGVALGAWLVYLGLRPRTAGEPIHWWPVGFGLLIGLGAVSSGFANQLVFPVVLIIVGLGMLGERYLVRHP